MATESIDASTPLNTLTLHDQNTPTIEICEPTASVTIEAINNTVVVSPDINLVEVISGTYGFGGVPNPNNPFYADLPCTTEIQSLVALAGMTYVRLDWVAQQDKYHRYYEVWRAENVDMFSAAELIGSSETKVFIDAVLPGVKYYYWVRGVNYAGNLGAFSSPVEVVAGEQAQQFADYLTQYINFTEVSGSFEDRIVSIIEYLLQTELATVNLKLVENRSFFLSEVGGVYNVIETIKAGYESDLRSVLSTITSEQMARAYGDEAMALNIDQLLARIDDERGLREAAIRTEQEARVLANSAFANQLETLTAAITDETSERKAAITTEQEARVRANDVLVSRTDSLEANLNDEIANRSAAIDSERQARVSQYGLTLEALDSMRGEISTAEANISGLVQAETSLRITNDEAVLRDVDLLRTDFNTEKAEIRAFVNQEVNVVSNETGAAVERLDTLEGRFDGFSGTIDGVNDRLILAEGRIEAEELSRANETGALAQSINTLTATWDGTTKDADGNPIYPAGSVEAALQSIRKTIVDSDLNAYTQYIDSLKATKADGTPDAGSLAAQLQSTREAAVSDLSSYTSYIDSLTATTKDLDGNDVPAEGSLSAQLQSAREAAVSDVSSTVQYVDSLKATKPDGTPADGSLAAQLESTRKAAVNDVSSTVQYVDTLKATKPDGSPAEGSLNALLESTRQAAVSDLSTTVSAVNTLTAASTTTGSVAEQVSTALTSANNYADSAASAAVTSFKTDVFDVKVKAIDAARRQGSNKIDTSFWNDTFAINGNITQTLADDSTVTWVLNGSASENKFATVTGPAGTLETVWRTDADNVSNADGGWVLDMPVDETKTYRSIVWVKRINGNGQFYLGCSTAKNATLLTNNTNPYYVGGWSGMTNNKWYMVVGILHKSSWGAPSGISGVYDPATGEKVLGGTDFIMNAGTKTQRHRVYQYYQTSANPGIMYFARPRFEVMDGTEPTLYELMSTADRQATLTTTAAVVDGLKAEYSVKTDVNGHIAGFGLYNEGATSDFIVNASKFAIAHPNATQNAVFTVENGKTVIDGAYIKSGTVGEYIASATFDGDLVSEEGDTRGTTGWLLDKSGNAVFHNAYVRGTIDATSGSFSGDITGARGTFTGDLSGSTITGSKITGTEIDGGFIRGSVIVSGTQLRNTEAGGDFFTYYDLQKYETTTNLTKYYQGGKDSADVRYRMWSPPFSAYAYNALPNGAAYPDRYMNSTVEFVFPQTTLNMYARGTSEANYTIQLQRADTGEVLVSLANNRVMTNGWQNNSGIEWYHSGQTYYTDSNGTTYNTGYMIVRGTYVYTHSGEAANYPLRWYIHIQTWRGSYGSGSGTIKINTSNESPVI